MWCPAAAGTRHVLCLALEIDDVIGVDYTIKAASLFSPSCNLVLDIRVYSLSSRVDGPVSRSRGPDLEPSCPTGYDVDENLFFSSTSGFFSLFCHAVPLLRTVHDSFWWPHPNLLFLTPPPPWP